MFGALEFSEKMAGAGIQPIVGCALGVDFADQEVRNPAAAVMWPRIVLLAAPDVGYRSLMRLCSRAYLETPQQERPHLKLAWLEGETNGLIALSGGPADRSMSRSPAARTRSRNRDARNCSGCSATGSISNCSAMACRPSGAVEPALIEFAYSRGIPLVATNEPFFARAKIRSPRCVALHRRRPDHRRCRPAAIDAGASLQEPRRNGGAVRRSAGSARRHRRDRRALHLPPAHLGADPAALYRWPRRATARARTKELRRAAEAGLESGSRSTAPRPAKPPRIITSGSPLSSASSSG